VGSEATRRTLPLESRSNPARIPLESRSAPYPFSCSPLLSLHSSSRLSSSQHSSSRHSPHGHCLRTLPLHVPRSVWERIVPHSLPAGADARSSRSVVPSRRARPTIRLEGSVGIPVVRVEPDPGRPIPNSIPVDRFRSGRRGTGLSFDNEKPLSLRTTEFPQI